MLRLVLFRVHADDRERFPSFAASKRWFNGHIVLYILRVNISIVVQAFLDDALVY